MTNKLSIIFLIAMLIVLIAAIVKLAYFLKAFGKNTRHLCYEMDHAKDYNEYRSWRKELRCHYLTLIPFVNEKGAMSVYRLIFRKSDSEKKAERKDSLMPLLFPSIFGIFVCIICVCSMTWAWYSADVQTTAQEMKSANYKVTVNSVMAGSDEVTPTDGKYTLIAGTEYTISLTASGDAGTGYCLIENADKSETYNTNTFKPEESITYELTPKSDGVFTFTGVWGSPLNTSSATTLKKLSTKSAVTSTKENTDKKTYTVKSGDTISLIADQFDTTVEKLVAYNKIDDPRDIKSGQVLKIPPKNYDIPETTTSSERTSKKAKTKTQVITTSAQTSKKAKSNITTTSAQISKKTKSRIAEVVTKTVTKQVVDDSSSQSENGSDSSEKATEEMKSVAE